MYHHLYILDGHDYRSVENKDDFNLWCVMVDDVNDERRVAKTEVGGKTVSTVFLAIDHGFGSDRPILFETMVFCDDPEWDNYCQRYSTWEEAERGHVEIVQVLKSLENNDAPSGSTTLSTDR